MLCLVQSLDITYSCLPAHESGSREPFAVFISFVFSTSLNTLPRPSHHLSYPPPPFSLPLNTLTLPSYHPSTPIPSPPTTPQHPAPRLPPPLLPLPNRRRLTEWPHPSSPSLHPPPPSPVPFPLHTTLATSTSGCRVTVLLVVSLLLLGYCVVFITGFHTKWFQSIHRNSL